MKLKITISILFLFFITINAQNDKKILVLNATEVTESKFDKEFSEEKLRYPKTKRRAIVGIKVLNRHKAKFYYNDKKITYREALKLVRKEFPNLLVKEDWLKEEIYFTTNTLKKR